MPMKTFFNLSESRQAEIRSTCFLEFERHGYEGASLARIIVNLGIARGSFYRYFEHKDDLFFYLAQYAVSITDRVLLKNFQNPDINFYDAWIGNFLDLHEEEDGNLAYLLFLSGISKGQLAVLVSKGIIMNPSKQFAVMKDIIKVHQDNGSIRKDLNDIFIILFVRQMRDFLREYLFYRHQSSSSDRTESWNILRNMARDELESELHLFTRFLKETLEPVKGSENEEE